MPIRSGKSATLNNRNLEDKAIKVSLNIDAEIYDCRRLGTGTHESSGMFKHFIEDDQFVFADLIFEKKDEADYKQSLVSFRRAGPRRSLHFNPATVRAAIVSCGGLCPGMNNIITELVRALHFGYGVEKVHGIRFGYRGFYDLEFVPYVRLTPQMCNDAIHQGGSILGSSRGGFDTEKIVRAIEFHGLNQIYVIGGDGTHRGANKLAREIEKRGLDCAIVGLPKTIDNDIPVIDWSFGFHTAVGAACDAIRAASVESQCYPHAVGLVKVMGRHAGFVAAHATLASSACDVCIIPEVDVTLASVVRDIGKVLDTAGTCVVVVAEGASKHFLDATNEIDASGNPVVKDVGSYLKKELMNTFTKKWSNFTVKYIDPSYMIRSIPADSFDAYQSLVLAQNAVHGAMAGYTGFSSGIVNNKSVFIPFEIITNGNVVLRPNGRTWERVMLASKQQRLRSRL